MDISPDQLAQIAQQLTPAQRRAVLAGGPTFGRGYWPLSAALHDKGLLAPACLSHQLSDLGRAVRDLLQKENDQ